MCIRTVANIAGELLRQRALLVPALQRRGYRVLLAEVTPETGSAIVSFYRPGSDLVALHQSLLAAGIVTSLRRDRAGEKYIRLSPHFYNTEQQIDQLIDVLLKETPAERRKWFRRQGELWYARLPRHSNAAP